MIGIVTSVCAMSTMAAPSFDHNKQNSHRFDKKPMQHKASNNHNRSSNHFGNNDRRDGKHFNNKNDHHNNGPKHKIHPMPPKHR